MEDKFTNFHAQISNLRRELKEEIDGVTTLIQDVEKSLENAWAAIEDVQQETKAYKDSKGSHQKMLDYQRRKSNY